MSRARRALAAGALLLVARAAAAQNVQVTTPVVLRERPDEHARVVERVAAGVTLPLAGRAGDGSWLRVRVGRREGWAQKGFFKPVGGPLPDPPRPTLAPPTTQTSAEAATPAPAVPHLDGWSTQSSFHARKRIRAVVLRRCDVHARTDAESHVVASLGRGAAVQLSRLSLDEAWGLVTEDGRDVGWVPMDAVRVREVAADEPPPASAASEPASDAASAGAPSGAGDADGAVTRRLAVPDRNSAVVLDAGAGVAVIARRFVSNGLAPLAAYELSTTGAAATVEGAYVRRLGGWALVGVDLAYEYAGGSRVQYRGADGSSVGVRLQAHDADGGLRLGVHTRAGGGVDLWLRGGVALDVTIIDPDVRVRLASDRLLAPTVGLGLAAPHLAALGSHWLGLQLFGRALVGGQLTENLSDGRAGGTFGGRFGGRLALALLATPSRGQLDLAAAYDYGFTVTRFSGASTRDPSATSGTLGTAQHLATLALAYAY